MSKKVKTIEPVRERRKFNTVEEFNRFYTDHEDEFQRETTCKLNKKYEIPGYRITKIQGEVSLKNIPESRQTAMDKIGQHNNRLATIESTLNTLIQRFNEVVTRVNDAMKEVQAMKVSIDEQNAIVNHLSQETQRQAVPEWSNRTLNECEPEKPSKNKSQDQVEDGPSFRSTGKMNPIAAQWAGLA